MASTLPSAKELMERAAQREAEKAAEAMRMQAKADDEKQALINRIQKLWAFPSKKAMRRVRVIIERAVNNGLTQSQVYRFPNRLCRDRKRANNRRETDCRQHPHRLAKESVRFLGAPASVLSVTSSSSTSSIFRTDFRVTSESR